MNAIQSFGLILHLWAYSKFVLKLAETTTKTVSYSTHCLSAQTYQVCVLALSRVMQHCSSLICNTVRIMVRRCLYSTNWLRLQHGMTKRMLKQIVCNIVQNLIYFKRNWAIYCPYKNQMQVFTTG